MRAVFFNTPSVWFEKSFPLNARCHNIYFRSILLNMLCLNLCLKSEKISVELLDLSCLV